MTEQVEKAGQLECRLLATGYDRDNFPRMNSERWLPVGLAKEAAAEIARLRGNLAVVALEYSTKFFDQGAEIARLRDEIGKWKSLAMYAELRAEIERLQLAYKIARAALKGAPTTEITRLRTQRDQLLACCNAARIILKNRDQRPNEVKVYEAICAAIAAVEDRND